MISRSLLRRLKRLEDALRTRCEPSQRQLELQAQLERARERCGIPSPSPARLAELEAMRIAGMSIADMLTANIQRAREKRLARTGPTAPIPPIDRDNNELRAHSGASTRIGNV
jgi:hypothetical protein